MLLPGGLAGSTSLPGAAFGEAPETSLACFANAGYLRDRLGLFSGPPECCFPNSSCQSLSLLPAGLRGAVRGGVPAPPGSLLGFATSLPPPCFPAASSWPSLAACTCPVPASGCQHAGLPALFLGRWQRLLPGTPSSLGTAPGSPCGAVPRGDRPQWLRELLIKP